jgi:ABC-type multidrug transport system fused ATPase/permease subunit
VRENIAYGRRDASFDEIVAAARAVGAHDFISRLPDGYDTEVHERGATLSVGQRQLISFARALLSDPRIIILDEATSSVDTETELIIQHALYTLLQGRTAFIIAHRLSTIKRVSRVVVLEHGRIIESGTHDELLAAQGAYYNLYTMQFRGQELQASAD